MEIAVMKIPGSHIHGWMSDVELLWLYETSKSMTRIAEIGSWQGRSTFALCSGCPGTVYAIDHFKGSEEHKNEQAVIEGTVRDKFKKNMRDFKNLVTLTMTSHAASQGFKDGYFDMVFIDGAHDYDSVLTDLKLWTPLASKLICGHDRDQDGVPKALSAIFGEVKREPGSLWSKQL